MEKEMKGIKHIFFHGNQRRAKAEAGLRDHPGRSGDLGDSITEGTKKLIMDRQSERTEQPPWQNQTRRFIFIETGMTRGVVERS